MQKKTIKVNLSEKKQSDWNDLREIFINGDLDFSIMNNGTSLNFYPENEHMWSIRLNRDGTWTLE